MGKITRYLAYARAPFLTASVVPVFVGGALAYKVGADFSWLYFILTLSGMVFAHLGINLFNDYHDYLQGADQGNRRRSPFNGGSSHLVEGTEKPGTIFKMAVFSLAIAAAMGGALAFLVDGGIGPIFWLALFGFLGGFFYTAPPLKFAYRGAGEIAILLNFGVLPTMGAYYVQTGSLALAPAVAGVAIGFAITNVLWINQFPDRDSDMEAGKRTLVVRMGTRRASYMYLVFLAGSASFIALPSFWPALGPYYALGLLGLLPSLAAAAILLRRHGDPSKLEKGQAFTILAHLAMGVLVTVGILI